MAMTARIASAPQRLPEKRNPYFSGQYGFLFSIVDLVPVSVVSWRWKV
jgi:hypothetical protein